MHRFFITREAFAGDGLTMTAEQAHQIRNVLRMRPGQHVVVLDNEGWEYEIVLDRVERQVVTAEILGKKPAANEPGAKVTLYQSLMQRDKYEWVLQKCTEVGVSRFVPVVTRRSAVRRATAITGSKLGRWQRIITEAAEQSQRGRIPELLPAMTFDEAVDSLDPGQPGLIPWERSSGPGLRDALSSPKPASIALFVGPEGGYADEEVAYAQERGVIPITLGRRILRAETAAVVVSAMVLYELGEMA